MACDLFLTRAQASGVALSIALYYLVLLTAASAFVQQIVWLPFVEDNVATRVLRTCGHLVLCVLVCSSSWLCISKFHASMVVNNTWREDGCRTENTASLGAEFVLHVALMSMKICMSTSNWLLSPVEEEHNHAHEE